MKDDDILSDEEYQRREDILRSVGDPTQFASMSCEYVTLPGRFSRYEINRNGNVRDKWTGETLNRYKSDKSPYEGVTLHPNDIERSITVHVHRLLALAFIPNNTGLDYADLEVNHINGVKDTDVFNLEWVTRKENVIHAYKNGLRPDNKPVEITNMITGERLEFYSQAEAARHMNISPSLLCLHIRKHNRNSFTYNHFHVKPYK